MKRELNKEELAKVLSNVYALIENEIIINAHYEPRFNEYYLTSAKPMTDIIWKRVYKVNSDLSVDFKGCCLFNYDPSELYE